MSKICKELFLHITKRTLQGTLHMINSGPTILTNAPLLTPETMPSGHLVIPLHLYPTLHYNSMPTYLETNIMLSVHSPQATFKHLLVILECWMSGQCACEYKTRD